MNALLATSRTLYFSAAIVIFGEFAFRLFVERAAPGDSPEASTLPRMAQRPRSTILWWALAAAMFSSVVWFLAEAAVMSGVPLPALGIETLHTALSETEFGRVSLLRFALALGLAIALLLARRDERSKAMTNSGILLALGLLSSIAWTGHANVEHGADGIVHMSSDLMHLFAAGAWLGALPALALVLFAARRNASSAALEFAAVVTQRFSVLGIASVATLTATGIANAWYTVNTLPALLGTDYGRLLALKIALFLAMLVLASINRFRHTPRLLQSTGCAEERAPSSAMSRLGTNAIGEIVLGIGVVCVVAALGIIAPATHVQTVWPFGYTVSWEAMRKHSVPIVLCVAALAAAILFAVDIRGHRRLAIASVGGSTIASAWLVLSLLAVPAHPTTYFRSPVRYSAESLASGARVYAERCSICHGAQGYGDGPAAASLSTRPANLIAHILHHHAGDVFWWIEHGIPGTPMPAFGEQISEPHVWDVINLLHARAEAEDAKAMGNTVDVQAIRAPDFTFQVDHYGQESLSDQRNQHSVLLAFFDPDNSLDRVRALSKSQPLLYEAGLRVIAMPAHASENSTDPLRHMDFPIVASFDPRVAAAYAVFAPRRSHYENVSALKDTEFLIDRRGYIRARWTLNADLPWTEISNLKTQVLAMDGDKARPSISHDDEHVH